MFKEGLLDKTLRVIKRFIPKSLFDFLSPAYHASLAWLGALVYGFPSRSMKVIGVTGTKGKSTTVFMLAKIFDEAGYPVAAIGSLGYKIKNQEWPNTLKMSMPGRFKMQKFLAQAKKAGCKYVVLEVTSEGLAQYRHLGIKFDCAVFTNLHPEHLERHGSMENYRRAKEKLFVTATNIHIINSGDPHAGHFLRHPAKQKITYGPNGDLKPFDLQIKLAIDGEFMIENALAAMATAQAYGVDLDIARRALTKIKEIPGRMQYIQRQPFGVVVDYAHTPDSLRAVYTTLKKSTTGKLICILGAAGGGRDKWKRPEFGKIAGEYCDEIILANEDPYEENPATILEEIAQGVQNSQVFVRKILDRRSAIVQALTDTESGDTVVVTGKGSETSMAVARGVKIPWSDAGVIRDLLQKGD